MYKFKRDDKSIRKADDIIQSETFFSASMIFFLCFFRCWLYVSILEKLFRLKRVISRREISVVDRSVPSNKFLRIAKASFLCLTFFIWTLTSVSQLSLIIAIISLWDLFHLRNFSLYVTVFFSNLSCTSDSIARDGPVAVEAMKTTDFMLFSSSRYSQMPFMISVHSISSYHDIQFSVLLSLAIWIFSEEVSPIMKERRGDQITRI